jgi:spore cortex formation protein SpoVR/YcgB (stage V sporulation)
VSALAAKPAFDRPDWTFDDLARVYDHIEEIARADLGLDVYPNQIEIISSEQMLDAYASIGMPVMYRHWSFGKRFARDEHFYRKGYTSLAYEIVINSNPCISYLMEENSMAMHTLVIAHAAFGHNHFFKNNYAFRQWTDASTILDQLDYAKKFIASCEERHGFAAVECLLDAAHALMDQGVFRYRRPPELTPAEQEERTRTRREHEERSFNPLWRTLVPNREAEVKPAAEVDLSKRKQQLSLPEENLLYFIERHSPVLEGWQREVLRIVREIAQYFYPQRQTKVMNEGCATFVHDYIVNAMFDRGLLSEGAMLEILHNHTSVVLQPPFGDSRYSGLNPYALGFGMMRDIVRMCTQPTAEDKEWFPSIAGCGDWRAVLKDAWANFRDESFIRQYLSPHLIRELKLFVLYDDADSPEVVVKHIHDERGYAHVREALANNYDLARVEPDIQVVDADLRGQRQLRLEHRIRDAIELDARQRLSVVEYIRSLWGYEVILTGIDESGNAAYEVKAA